MCGKALAIQLVERPAGGAGSSRVLACLPAGASGWALNDNTQHFTPNSRREQALGGDTDVNVGMDVGCAAKMPDE